MRCLVLAAPAAAILCLFASGAQARCSYITERTLTFNPGGVECHAFGGDHCSLFNGHLDYVAETWRRAGGGLIRVIGFSDTFASVEESYALSVRRVIFVRQQLADRGIPFDHITTEARDENDLARPTGDGVAELLNNRVVIEFSDSNRLLIGARVAALWREYEAALAAGIEPPPTPPCP